MLRSGPIFSTSDIHQQGTCRPALVDSCDPTWRRPRCPRWCLLLIALGSSYLSARTDSLAREAFAAGDVGRRMSDIYEQLVGAESGQRGYLITLDDKYLGPFRAARGPKSTPAIEELQRRAGSLVPTPAARSR